MVETSPIIVSSLVVDDEPRILCLIPALPMELRLETLKSIFGQTVPVTCTVLLTEKIKEHLPFPAKISKVLNNGLTDLRLENYDYLLRVDADTVLPPNFIKDNLKMDYDVLGYGPAQLIKVDSFLKYMGGRMYPSHDDGYPIVKFKQCGLKASSRYFVEPVIQRKPGFHQGTSWFVSQGELQYCYGYDILYEFAIVLYKWRRYHPYGLFYLVGYFKALFERKQRFDVAAPVLAHNSLKYKNPLRFFRFANKKLRRNILRRVSLCN